MPRVNIGCKKHGLIRSQPIYASFQIGNYVAKDVPCVYCEKCKCYYTTSLSIHILENQMVKGCPLKKGKMINASDKEKTEVKKTEIKKGSFNENACPLPIKKNEKKEFKGATIVSNDLILCNIQEFWDSKICPRCRQITKRVCARIKGYFSPKYVYEKNTYCCVKCGIYYISRETLERINLKAKEKFGINSFVHTDNVNTQIDMEGKYLFIPKSGYKTGAPYYDVKYGGFYMPTSAEKEYTAQKEYERFYEDDYEDDYIPLREKSILGELGYSTDLHEAKRKWILEGAVEKYGKVRVINTIEMNIHLKEAQTRDYSRAIGIWRRDIEYVKTIDDSDYLKNAEIERRKWQEKYEAEAETKRLEKERHFAEQNVFWWENKNK